MPYGPDDIVDHPELTPPLYRKTPRRVVRAVLPGVIGGPDDISPPRITYVPISPEWQREIEATQRGLAALPPEIRKLIEEESAKISATWNDHARQEALGLFRDAEYRKMAGLQ